MGMKTERKIGDSIELVFGDVVANIGILATSKNSVILDITAPKDILIRDVKNSHEKDSYMAVKRKADKKKVWELLNGNKRPVERFELWLKNLNDHDLVNVPTNTPEEEIAVAKEMQSRGLL